MCHPTVRFRRDRRNGVFTEFFNLFIFLFFFGRVGKLLTLIGSDGPVEASVGGWKKKNGSDVNGHPR